MSLRSILMQTLSDGKCCKELKSSYETNINDVRDVGRILKNYEILEFDRTDTCSICLSGAIKLENGQARPGLLYEPMIMLHTCKHVLHLNCLEQFIRRCQDRTIPRERKMSKRVCPVCRQKFSQIRSPRRRGMSPQRRTERNVDAKRDDDIRRETHHLLSNLKITRCIKTLKRTENRLEEALRQTEIEARNNSHKKRAHRSFRKRNEHIQLRRPLRDGVFEESGVIL